MFIVGKIKSAKGHTMPYIKLLTVLTTLALLTACGGGGGTAETKTDDKGEGTSVCTTNAFHADCGTEFQTQRLNIVSECRTDNTGDFCNDAITFFCDETTIRDLLCRETTAYKDLIAMEQNECLTRTGSQPACDEEERVKNCEASAFSTNCADTKYVMQRETMCLANIAIDPSCDGEMGIATVFCKDDPFNTATACMHKDYDDDRQTACLASITTNPLCMGAQGIATLFCTANPFDPSNACMHGDYADERLTECTGDITTPRCMQIVTPVCEANNGFNNPVCRGIEKYDEQLRCAGIPACADGVITHADWVEGFDTPPNTEADNARNEPHEFLQGTPNGLDDGNIVNGIIDSTIVKLDLESFGGEAKNGVAWFAGATDGIALPILFYSGIFSGTDLGAPLTSADVSVSVPWAGRFGGLLYNQNFSGDVIAQNFALTVDFANSEIRGFVKRTSAASNTEHFLLNAEFDDRGRFDGTIIHGVFAGNDKDATPTNATNGVLTGLIGELGAVGVFISDKADIATTNNAYTGGFVAISQKEVARIEQERLDLIESQVTFTDWIGGFDTEPPATPSTTPTNQFLAGTTTLDPLTTATPTLLTSTIGGVGFFTENSQYYAGLLSNTNVGLPVADTPQADNADVTAMWPGMIRGIGIFDGSGDGTNIMGVSNVIDKLDAVSFMLTVNFTTRTLTTGRIAEPIVIEGRLPIANIQIDGKFLATDDGVITGRVIQRHGAVEHLGDLTGVIGQNGAVGAFYSQSTVVSNRRFVGGFYAAPQ